MANPLKYLSVLLWFNLPLVSLGQTNTFPTTGNVGIGTTTPNALFQIIQNNNQFSIRPESNQSGTLISSGQAINLVFNDNNVGTDFFSIRANGTTFSTSDELLRIIANGNVGIGTINPLSKLQVEGRIATGKWGVLHLDWTNEHNWGGSSNKWAGYIGFNAYRDNEDAKDYFYGTNRYTSKGVFEGSNYGFRWLYRSSTNNDSDGQHLLTEYMRLTSSGNLGIGTPNPDAKLAVKGDIHAQEVKVDLNGAVAPDYVFKEGYDLRSLQEVQDYIKEHGHLPNIPSAQEMEANGIDLGQMNLKLLEKIEELTLYALKQEKKLDQQQGQLKELDVLKERISEIETLLNTNQK